LPPPHQRSQTRHEDDEVSTDEILAYLKTCLASYKVPKRVIFVDEHDLHHTASEKVKVADLQQLAAQRIAGEDGEWGAYLAEAHPELVGTLLISAPDH